MFNVGRAQGIVCIAIEGESLNDGTHLDAYCKDIPELIQKLQAKYDEYVEELANKE